MPAPCASHRASTRRARARPSTSIYTSRKKQRKRERVRERVVESVTQIERLVESVSGPTNRRGFHCMPGACRARAGRAPHTRRAPGVPPTTPRRAPRARLTVGVRQARARPSTSRKKEKDFGRLETKRERKRLVESVSGSRNKSVCIASQAPRERASHNTDARAQHACAGPSTSI